MTAALMQIGDRQITAEQIVRHLTNSQLLPQFLRELVVDEVLERWEDAPEQPLAYSPEEFEQLCQQVSQIATFQGMNAIQVQTIAARNLKVQKFKEAAWGYRLNSYFLQRKEELDKIVCSVMQVDDGSIAQELFFRVLEEEQSFSEVARVYSQGPAAESGGQIGPLSLKQLHPAIAEKLSTLKPGQLSPLFKLENSFVFVKLDRLITAQFTPEMRQQLLDELFEQWLQSQIGNDIGSAEVTTAPKLPGNYVPPVWELTSTERKRYEVPQDAADLILSDAANLDVWDNDRSPVDTVAAADADLRPLPPSPKFQLPKNIHQPNQMNFSDDISSTQEPTSTTVALSPAQNVYRPRTPSGLAFLSNFLSVILSIALCFGAGASLAFIIQLIQPDSTEQTR
jgi:parvulin-like peptidyl-prolyl isomerase